MKSHSHLCECNLFVVVAISRAAAAVVVVVVATTTTAIVLFYFIFFLQNILLSSALAISIAIFFISIWILFHFILFAYEQNNHFDFPPVCLIAACGSHLFIGAFHWVWLVVGCVGATLFFFSFLFQRVLLQLPFYDFHACQYELSSQKRRESFILKSKQIAFWTKVHKECLVNNFCNQKWKNDNPGHTCQNNLKYLSKKKSQSELRAGLAFGIWQFNCYHFAIRRSMRRRSIKRRIESSIFKSNDWHK